MNLIDILKKYKASDLEKEQKQKGIGGTSTSELWEINKLEEEPKDFTTFVKELKSQSIKINE